MSDHTPNLDARTMNAIVGKKVLAAIRTVMPELGLTGCVCVIFVARATSSTASIVGDGEIVPEVACAQIVRTVGDWLQMVGGDPAVLASHLEALSKQPPLEKVP